MQNHWHNDCSAPLSKCIEKVYKDTAMNISMQTRRALITLSIAAMAIVFVAAKASMGADAQARSDAPVRTESVFVAQETFTSPVIVPMHVSVPMLIAKERSVRKIARSRCERVSDI
jgi:hypothetical protein